jgi:hypothetical protein
MGFLLFVGRPGTESLNKPRAGATEAMWDVVLGASPKQYREYCEGLRQRNAPTVPRPAGLGPKRASAASRSLPIFAILASSRFLHPPRFGSNALHVGLVQRFPAIRRAPPLVPRVAIEKPERSGASRLRAQCDPLRERHFEAQQTFGSAEPLVEGEIHAIGDALADRHELLLC